MSFHRDLLPLVFPLADPAQYGEILGDGLPDSKGDRLLECKLDNADFLLDLIGKLPVDSPERHDLEKVQIITSKIKRSTPPNELNNWHSFSLDSLKALPDDDDDEDLLDTSPPPDLKIDTMSNPELSPGLVTLPRG